MLLDVVLSNDFLRYDIKSIDNRCKNRQVGLHQTKKLQHSKETINTVKRQPKEWEKVFANYVSDKESVSQICKGLKQLKNKKGKNNNDLKNGPWT